MTPPKTKANGECGEELDRFNEFFEDLLSPDSSTARSVFPFIRSKLFQYKLRSQYDEVAVLMEVYVRSMERIARGGTITNPSAWTNSVAYRIIREFSRKQDRVLQADEYIIDNIAYCDGSDDVDLTDEMLKVRDAFMMLSPKEQILIYRKEVLNESWITIQDFLKIEGHGEYTIQALRKQKERALANLRKIYHGLCEA